MAHENTMMPGDADDHLSRLLAPAAVEIPWYKSIIPAIKELIHPTKLPPLEITSKPVEVKDIWGSYGGNEKRAGMMSLLVHGGVIGLIIALSLIKPVRDTAKHMFTSIIAPDLPEYKPAPQKKDTRGGGGGGGDRSPTPVTKGKLPKLSDKQFVPPMLATKKDPKLVMDPTLIIQQDAPVPTSNINQLGDPLSKLLGASNGTGSGGGMGSGSGGGIGPGRGPGYGPGSGGNFGGGAYKIGGGVSAPVPIFKPEPEYSEEARKAKFQGTVVLFIVVDEKGNARDLKVIRPLGLGLDQKAIEAVAKWKFRPGMKDGHAVPVQATIEVNFRLL
jgi:TonB family protein